VRGHVAPRIGRVPLAKLRPVHIQKVVDEMLAEGLAPRTVLQAYRVLSAALNQAVRWQLLATNAARAASPPRPERPVPSIPDAETLALILAASGRDWFRVALVLATTTGLRRGEVLALPWRDVDLEARRLRVNAALQEVGGELRRVEPKTDRARRTVALPEATIAVLRAHRLERNRRRLLVGEAWQDLGLVLDRGDGGAIHPNVFSRRFQRLVRRLELPAMRLHDLRHAYATTLLLAGVHPKIVSEALGHTSTSFTMDTYQHLLPSLGSQAAEAVDRLLGDAVRGDS
jgi:integrase